MWPHYIFDFTDTNTIHSSIIIIIIIINALVCASHASVLAEKFFLDRTDSNTQTAQQTITAHDYQMDTIEVNSGIIVVIRGIM